MSFELKQVLTEELEKLGGKVKTELQKYDDQIASLKGQLIDLAQQQNTLGPGAMPGGEQKGIIDLVTKSSGFQAMKSGARGTGLIELDVPITEIKSVTNPSLPSQAQRFDGVFGESMRRPRLLDMLTRIQVSASQFEFIQTNGYSNAATEQASELTNYAAAAVPTQAVTANIASIGHFLTASSQVIADNPTLSMNLGTLLNVGVLQKLEDRLINGTGGQGQIDGLLNQATPFVPTGTPSPADQIGQAITALQGQGWNPGLVVMHPNDWFAIASSKGTSMDGYLMGSPRDPAPLTLWNTPVVLSPVLAAGTALVMDLGQVALLDRQSVLLEFSRDSADLVKGQVTMLATARAGLAVMASDAVLELTL